MAEVTTVRFPGELRGASKDRPYYDEVIQKLQEAAREEDDSEKPAAPLRGAGRSGHRLGAEPWEAGSARQALERSPTVLGPRRLPIGRIISPAPLISLGLAEPVANRLRRAAELAGDRADRRPLRVTLVLVLEDDPDCPFPHLR